MSSLANKFALPERYKGTEKSVWTEFIQLAVEYQPLNLGQGFPDFAAPEHITKALGEAASSKNPLTHQYARGYGHIPLVNALSKLYSKMIGRQLDPMKEIMVTSGAYEALYSCIAGHVCEGDEVILIEPFFDCYEPMVKFAGGKCVFIPLRPTKTSGEVTSRDWKLDPDELKGLFNERTKMIILNTPHNPLGKVFTLDELNLIADLCKKWNVLCLSDEVYEWMVYKPNKHYRIATLPGMWERTITIGSAGKTFSVTGWKLGWAYGPFEILRNAFVVHQNCVNSCNTPAQYAVAKGFEIELERLGREDCYLQSLAVELEEKRNFMGKFLRDVGMNPVIPEGGYFMLADWSPLVDRVNMDSEPDPYKDYRFAKWMSKNLKLQGIPPSAFYSSDHKSLCETYIRFCFIKEDHNLEKARDILTAWVKNSGKL